MDLSKKNIGEAGERIAEQLLVAKGYEVVERNYRYQRGEVDLIVQKGAWLVFVEVKKRSNNKFGEPEDFVTANQKKLIVEVADDYVHAINWAKNIRFDIVAIKGMEVLHMEDAFF